MVICLKPGANDLHMLQPMPLPLRHRLLYYKCQNDGLPFCCWLLKLSWKNTHLIPCVPKSEPLNILQQQPQICSDLNKILHTQDDVYYKHYYLLQLQPFSGLFSRTTWVSRYQKGKTNLDFTGARDSEWQ